MFIKAGERRGRKVQVHAVIVGQLLAEFDRRPYASQQGAHHFWQRVGVSPAHLAANDIRPALIPAQMAKIDGPSEDLMPRVHRAEWTPSNPWGMPTRGDCVLGHHPHVAKALSRELAAHDELANALDRHAKKVGGVSQGQ